MTKPPRQVSTRPRMSNAPRHGVARVISKLGLGSRTQAAEWVRAGRVRVNGRVVRDAELPVRQGLDRIDIDGEEPAPAARVALMLNKPARLGHDGQGREGPRHRVQLLCGMRRCRGWRRSGDSTKPARGCCYSAMIPPGPLASATRTRGRRRDLPRADRSFDGCCLAGGAGSMAWSRMASF